MVYFLSAYTYTLENRPGKSNGNADLLSRLPLPASEADNHPDVRLSDPTDIDVYLIGASGVQIEQLAANHDSQHQSGYLDPGFIFAVGERAEGCAVHYHREISSNLEGDPEGTCEKTVQNSITKS